MLFLTFNINMFVHSFIFYIKVSNQTFYLIDIHQIIHYSLWAERLQQRDFVFYLQNEIFFRFEVM